MNWLICLSLVLSFLPGCTSLAALPNPASIFDGWQAADLRWLQAPTDDPAHSLIGVYSRLTPGDLEIRLDFFDLTAPIDFDTYLVLDTRAGGAASLPLEASAGLAYDLLVKIPAGGPAVALDPLGQPLTTIVPRVADSPTLDLMTVQLNRAKLPGNPSGAALQVFITPAGQTSVLCQTPPILPGSTRPDPARLLMVFWNTLPSATPAQTLRRWAGAHTGPMGGRHGLSVLLQAAISQGIPLVLADLAQPADLAGLKAVSAELQIKQAALRADLILPGVAYGDPALSRQSLELSRAAALSAGLSQVQLAFGAFTDPLPDTVAAFFAQLPDTGHLIIWQGKRLVPLPNPVYAVQSGESEPQADAQGISLALRGQLIAAALSGDPGRVVVAGGSLPESTWGEFSVAPAAFAYIAAHPWIRPMAEEDLMSLPARTVTAWPLPPSCKDLLCSPAVPDLTPFIAAGQAAPSGITLPRLQADLRARLAVTPVGLFSDLGWQSYLALTRSNLDQNLAGLQANVLGQVGYLLAAARWNANPVSQADCGTDLDSDGIPECILASPDWFVVLKLDGGRLVFAADRRSQWIGSSAQFALGLSDPSEWHPEIGPGADPAEIPGAFAPLNSPFEAYTPAVQSGRITLTSPTGDVRKAYSISTAGLRVDLSFPQSETIRIPVTLAPQDWFSAAAIRRWQPPPRLDINRWIWQPASGAGLQISFQGVSQLSASSFLDSFSLMNSAENPNLAYPPGHYLPYPLAQIELQGQQISILFSALK